MINNFDIIRKFLSYNDPDYFYFGQIIQRKKDNVDLKRNARIVKSYYIHSDEHLTNKMEEVITLCNLFNARFYLNPNVRSLKRCTLEMVSDLLENIKSEQYTSLQNKLDSVCGYAQTPHAQKYWVLDVDDKSLNIEQLKENLLGMQKFELILPTIQGYHILIKPFDVSKVQLPDCVEVKKNSPTLIYYNNK